ncbi:MAG: hypothetical protein SO188_00545 [Prevotella sp.]|nr:hypothetical protein [Prevotella sp.]
MKLYLANPIYDAVFKYLMEDERIARTLISALLKKKVVHLEQRPHEYVNTTRNNISMFRIDFGATIREDDGHEHLVLIELQKTWLETETLRFRQNLGAQYNRKENIVGKGKDTHALPMVAVYILGHLVDGFHVPVVYVNHKTYDYDGNLLETNGPSPFVDSLTHNSIIVQIPLLHGHVNNRLEQILSVFDQTNVTKNSQQTIEVDDNEYAGDAEMEYIVKRLLSAASDPNVRQEMNVEDEFFKAIEDRDTAIMARDKTIDEQGKALQEKDQALQEKDKLLSNAIEGMLEKGMDLTTISSILGLTEVEVKKFLVAKSFNY